MSESNKRNFFRAGALLWASVPMFWFFFLVMGMPRFGFFGLLLAHLPLLAGAGRGWKSLSLVASFVAGLGVIALSAQSMDSWDFLFCLWVSNMGVLLPLRSESKRCGYANAADSFTSAALFITVLLWGEPLLGYAADGPHGALVRQAGGAFRIINVLVFGGGCWLYCLSGASKITPQSAQSSDDSEMSF